MNVPEPEWFLDLTALVLICVATFTVVTTFSSFYGKEVRMKSLYRHKWGRISYIIIGVFLIIAAAIFLYKF